jgi:5,5'-dehydrodivanillate O-demethylase oxygenase subunit
MLTRAENERLSRVGRGTFVGELLRRYWHPVAGSSQLDEEPVLPVTILGEELVLYRDRGGEVGLLGAACPHRKVSLAYGIPEEHGLRCCYHGWLFDCEGRCLEQPAEPPESSFKDRVQHLSYPVQELGGLVWAYLGPKPAPLLPRFDVFVWEDAWRDVAVVDLPCNWLQCMENSLDLTHVDWLHGRYYSYVLEWEGLPPWPQHERRSGGRRIVRMGFDLTDHGMVSRRMVEGDSEDAPEWRKGSNPLLFPCMVRAGGRGSMQMRIPIDDTHTRLFFYSCYRPDDGLPVPPQERVPVYAVPAFGPDGRWRTDWINGQDNMAWAMQGALMDRETERLGSSDKGITVYRRLLAEEAEKVKRGEDPVGVMRDPAANVRIELKDNEAGPPRGMGFMDNHWHQFSPIFEEAKALMLRSHR